MRTNALPADTAALVSVKEPKASGSVVMRGVLKVIPTVELKDEFADFEIREDLERELEKRLTEFDDDARPALKAIADEADDDQRAVINTVAKTIRLVAPAGAGKTQTIINRILSLVAGGSRPERILCLTFDNSATRALRSKVEAIVGASNLSPDQFQITTLNAFGFRILRENFPSEYKGIIEPNRVWRLIREIQDELKNMPHGRERSDALPDTLKWRFYANFFSLLKNSMFDPRDCDPQTVADFMLKHPSAEAFFSPDSPADQKKLVIQAVFWMFKQYEKVLQRERKIDFDDQKLRAVRCLQAHPSTQAIIQRRYEELIVDEFQDINRLDFEFVKLLAAQSRLLVTGDDDQAIYGFRGCSPEYIINLQQHLGRTVETLELSRNYRCPRNIVDHATRLIGHNTVRIQKKPLAVRSDNATIKVVDATTATAEAKMIANNIERIRRKNPVLSFNDFCVLYRTNAQSLPIQLQFILRDIPYFVRPEDNILTNEELIKLLGALRAKLAMQEGNCVASSDAVLTIRAYFRYVAPSLESKLEDYFSINRPFAELISNRRFHSIFPKAENSRFRDAVNDLAKAPSLFKALDILAKNFNGLRGMIGDLEDVVAGDVPLGEVYELAASFRGSIHTFVDTVDAALKKANAENAGRVENGVVLATYFKAKGLQWHTVVLTSCNQGIIPHRRAPTEDERRLFYVALTRASSNLIVSYLKTSCRTKVVPSTFLREAGLHG